MRHSRTHTPPSPHLLERFERIVGPSYVLRDPLRMRPFLTEWRDRFQGRAAAVLCPGRVDEVSAIMSIASEARLSIVPQGGNTGLVGGQIPLEGGYEILLSLGRLDRILDLNTESNTMVVEAGCTLGAVRNAARSVGRLFPLRLGPGGQSQIGGNISTNAGGADAFRHGSMREMILGLQVVLADGRVWDGLRHLRKDNAGYDLKQLFIGAEGTLGIITAAVLKLLPRPRTSETVCLALRHPTAAVALFHEFMSHFGYMVRNFELIPEMGVRLGLRHIADADFPFSEPFPWFILTDLFSNDAPDHLRLRIDHFLEEIVRRELVLKTARARDGEQARAFWRLRTGLSAAQKQEGGSIKHDIALPINLIPRFLDEAAALVEQLIPGARPIPFGHLGDGNLHYNISQPVGADKTAFLARWDEVSASIHALVMQYQGSIAAEHGIGYLKRALLPEVRSDVEMSLMRRLKKTLDPNNILNAGKILSS